MNSNIAFFKDDDPHAGERLADMLERTSQPVVGLILKVEGGRVVNWMLAEPLLLKSLAALSLPSETSSKE